MSVKVAGNASVNFKATLDDFKNAFSLTESGGFKSSVGRTKGELYVGANGKLRSANIHGGKGTVQSTVANFALRQALYDAFKAEGASAEFLADVCKRFHLDSDLEANKTLLRSDVKSLIVDFEHDCDEKAKTVGTMALNRLNDDGRPLDLNDFRILARGSGFVSGKIETKLDEKKTDVLIVDQPGIGNDAYYSMLRFDLYNAVREAPVPKEREVAQESLVYRLDRTLIAPGRLHEPLSCDEIRRTLKALDEGLYQVPPKPLTGRNISVRKAMGDKGRLAELCQKYESHAELIRRFLARNLENISSDNAGVLLCLANLKAEWAEIGRQALGRNTVDVKRVKAQMDQAFFELTDSRYGTRYALNYIRKSINENRSWADEKAVDANGEVDEEEVDAKDEGDFFYLIDNCGSYGELKSILTEDPDLERRIDASLIETDAEGYIGRVLGDGDSVKNRVVGEKLTAYINKQVGSSSKSKNTSPFCLHRSDKGLCIPHSCGNIVLSNDEDLKKLTIRMAFLADMLKRPIVLLSDVSNGKDYNDMAYKNTSTMYFYNRNMKTGKKLTGEPLVLYYIGTTANEADGTLQEVALSQRGFKMLDDLKTGNTMAGHYMLSFAYK